MNTNTQGAIGVGKAISYYTSKSIPVFVPISDISRYDLIIDDNGLKRVEVKTTNSENGWFMLRTVGGNRSWNGIPKHLSSKDCDKVFLYDLKYDIHKELDISDLEGKSSIKIR